jgi:hypothetical protein
MAVAAPPSAAPQLAPITGSGASSAKLIRTEHPPTTRLPRGGRRRPVRCRQAREGGRRAQSGLSLAFPLAATPAGGSDSAGPLPPATTEQQRATYRLLSGNAYPK